MEPNPLQSSLNSEVFLLDLLPTKAIQSSLACFLAIAGRRRVISIVSECKEVGSQIPQSKPVTITPLFLFSAVCFAYTIVVNEISFVAEGQQNEEPFLIPLY